MRRRGLGIERGVGGLHEALDRRDLERGWKEVFGRHEVLRKSVRWRKVAKPHQEVHEDLDLDFFYEDWTDRSSPGQKQKFAEWLARDRERGFDPETPPLMRVALIRLKKTHYRFVWTFHHLLLDATAFAIVLKEAFAFYEATHEGYELGLSSPISFQAYIQWLGQQSFGEDQGFWRSALKGFEEPTPLVVAGASARALVGKEATHEEQTLRHSDEENAAFKTST